METPDLVYALGLPPRDAVAYLESKGVRATRHWHDIWQEAQAKAVTVSGMTRLDLLEDVKAGLVDEMCIRDRAWDALSPECRKELEAEGMTRP